MRSGRQNEISAGEFHFRSACFGAMIFVLMFARSVATGPVEGPAVQLEPFIIEASSEAPWQYLAIPGFEILSRCPDDFTAVYAQALRKASAARLALLPADFWGELPTPLKVVLYNRKPEAPKNFGPGNPIDLSWKRPSEAILGAESVRVTFPATVGDGDEFINCGNYWNVHAQSSSFSVDPDSAIRLRNRVPQFPVWFVMGLVGPSGLFANRFIEPAPAGDFVVLPNALWLSSAETLALQKDHEQKRKGKPFREPPTLLPLARLFSGDIPEEQRDLWNAQTALLARWGLYGKRNDGTELRAGFLEFVDGTTREPPTEKLFQKCLGLSYTEAELSLRAFLIDAVSEPIRRPLPVGNERAVKPREATPTEVARIIGDWARMEARKLGALHAEYQRKCLEQADRLFERKYADANRDPLFLAAFGLYAAQIGDEGRAEKALRVAIAAGVIRPGAYVELARLRLKKTLPAVMQGIGDLNPTEYGEILALLATARGQMPALPASYRILARTMRHAPVRPAREDFEALREGLRLFPYDVDLTRTVADLYQAAGYPEEAGAIVERARKFSDSAEARSRLSRFMADQSRRAPTISE